MPQSSAEEREQLHRSKNPGTHSSPSHRRPSTPSHGKALGQAKKGHHTPQRQGSITKPTETVSPRKTGCQPDEDTGTSHSPT